MTAAITVEYQGREVTLSELAQILGMTRAAISARYAKGERGDVLCRPMNIDQNSILMREETAARRAKTTSARAIAAERKQRRRESIARVKAEHARLFSEAFIDASLLTDAERAKIRGRVHSVQRWLAPDGGLLR